MKVATTAMMMKMQIPLKLDFLNLIAKMQSVFMSSVCCLAKKKLIARMAIDVCLFSPIQLLPHVITLIKGLDVESPSSLSFSLISSSSTSTKIIEKIIK